MPFLSHLKAFQHPVFGGISLDSGQKGGIFGYFGRCSDQWFGTQFRVIWRSCRATITCPFHRCKVTPHSDPPKEGVLAIFGGTAKTGDSGICQIPLFPVKSRGQKGGILGAKSGLFYPLFGGVYGIVRVPLVEVPYPWIGGYLEGISLGVYSEWYSTCCISHASERVYCSMRYMATQIHHTAVGMLVQVWCPWYCLWQYALWAVPYGVLYPSTHRVHATTGGRAYTCE